MKTNVAVLLVGAVAGQILLLGSGCKDPDVLAPRGYQVPQAVPDPDYTTEPARKTSAVPVKPAPAKPEVETFTPDPVYNPPAFDSIPKAPPADNTPEKYVVQKGDTLGKIGQRYGVGAAALAKYNNLDVKKYIRVGQTIMIPPPGTVIHVERTKPAAKKHSSGKSSARSAASSASSSGNHAALADGYYVVRSGDSISKIAARFKVKRADLMKANSINSNTILQIGQKLVIPGKSPSGTAAVSRTSSSAPVKPAASAQSVAPAPADGLGSPVSPVQPGDKSLEGILDGVEDPAVDGGAAAATPAAVAPVAPVAPAGAPAADGVSAASNVPPSTPVTATSLTSRRSIDIPADTTWEKLATMYGTTVDELKRLNPDVRDEKTVRAGKILFIP